MPDFLNRLAARALGAVPFAEPLVPARFDPGTAHAALTPFDSINRLAEASGAIAEAGDHVFPHQVPAASRASGLAGFGPPSGDLDDSTHLIRSRDRHQQQFANESRASSPDAQSTRLAVSALPVHSRTSEAADGVPPIADAGRAPTLPLFAEPRPTLIDPALEPDRVPGPQQQRMSASHHAPPTVRINIGRIEVRAELPAPVPAPAPQRSRTSYVSLEQFLKQAGGGAR
jgi:hypothetical protein